MYGARNPATASRPPLKKALPSASGYRTLKSRWTKPAWPTKAELAELLFERVGLNKREAKDIVDTFFEEIRDALARGDSVKLSGFGNFQVRNKPPRPGRNPKTGETIPIAARRVVTFHASQKLKSVVEQAEPAGAPDGGE